MSGCKVKYDYEQVISLLAQEESTIDSVAQQMGISESYMYTFCKRNNIDIQSKKNEERISIDGKIDVYKLEHCVLTKDHLEAE